jgi:uroporphyrinogen-III synthase
VKALAGKRVVITRAEEQAGPLREMLESRGACVVMAPMIRIAPPEDTAALDAALRNLAHFEWLIFTSQNAVQYVADRAAATGVDLRHRNPQLRVATVGPATARCAEEAGMCVEYAAKTHRSAALARELASRLKRARVLLPRSDRASAELPERLRGLGATVTDVIAYCTVDAPGERNTVAARASGADAVLFFSPSAVRAFAAAAEFSDRRGGAPVLVAVGPVTKAALRDAGAARVVQARDAAAEAVVSALERHFSGRGKRHRKGKR